jgi:hypothetical protein
MDVCTGSLPSMDQLEQQLGTLEMLPMGHHSRRPVDQEQGFGSSSSLDVTKSEILFFRRSASNRGLLAQAETTRGSREGDHTLPLKHLRRMRESIFQSKGRKTGVKATHKGLQRSSGLIPGCLSLQPAAVRVNRRTRMLLNRQRKKRGQKARRPQDRQHDSLSRCFASLDVR